MYSEVLFFLCKSVLELDNYIFQEYADTQLIIGESRDNGAAPVRM
jgi:hypothetical protein